MRTPSDLRNPNRESGYRYVTFLRGGRPPGSSGYSANRKDKYRAHKVTASGDWYGPCRLTALEAAQDACDFINSGRVPVRAVVSYPDVEIDMGNTKRHAPRPEKVTVVREKFRGPHDVYDVLFLTARGDIMCRKVGITARGHARYADVCKTFGMSVTPFEDAVTFPSEEDARVAEAEKIAQIEQSVGWRRIGKESFAPRGSSTHWVINAINSRKAVKEALAA